MVSISAVHSDLIHDAELDYYGKRLATCSSDKTIKLFEVDGENQKLLDTLRGHEGPVWQIGWAHPKFGVILASCSYDGKVLIWREENGQWSNISQHTVHHASVNSVQWAPPEYGAALLCASSDGTVSVLEFKDEVKPDSVVIPAHQIGVNAAAWAPALPGATEGPAARRFVTGGSDNLVKTWKYDSALKQYVEEATLEGHTDWVRDVAWSPSLLGKSHIASASQDKTVVIWTQGADNKWEKKLLKNDKFPDVVWRVSWSLSGNVLAVSGGDSKISLWKENLQGDWEPAGEVSE